MLTSRPEIFLRAAPVHTGADPLGGLAGQGDTAADLPFETCVFDGPFAVAEDGLLKLMADEADVPAFLREHVEVKAVGVRAENPVADAQDLEGDHVHLPLFRPGFRIYGHWLIDILPHVRAFREAMPTATLHILLLEGTPAWAERLIETFFGGGHRITRVRAGQTYSGRLFLSTSTRHHDALSRHTVALGDHRVAAGDAPLIDGAERIYVARRANTSGRVLTNKHQLETMLDQLGFTRLYPEDFGIEDQMRIFASAKCIIGEAGSGLHNTIFARPDAEVFVIQSSCQPHLIQSGLCRLKDQKVTYIWAAGETADWFAPFTVDLRAVWTAVRSFLTEPFPDDVYRKKPMFSYAPKEYAFGNVHYIDFMKNMNLHCHPSAYFEIGTETGASVAAFSCASVCVDPNFKLSVDVVGQKPSLNLFQMPSDTFFSSFDLRSLLPAGPDVSFLDGMHRFEYLLRDFINVERLCHNRSSIMIHDCYPVNNRMALRQHVIGDESESGATRFGWTGDVWKIVPILKQHRPDLRMFVINAPPSGLLVINNLDPSSEVLDERYFQILEEYRGLNLGDYGLDKLWSDYPFVAADKLLEHPDELTTFFPHG